ncbi:hypothetical protein IMPR6_180111 [Imperialibacter sp. EC-SDR9]|nr:hypothetical protein IMPERIA89_300109 [Imperialibacter sp. 89]CAD5270279.1 hypothetical protein IMPERIA75_360110 [Imperialibacter sp. 75]VVT09903.1 hypothetical protein IMPR6_180111 [Imperialibacter sp. EC-SDR9]
MKTTILAWRDGGHRLKRRLAIDSGRLKIELTEVNINYHEKFSEKHRFAGGTVCSRLYGPGANCDPRP